MNIEITPPLNEGDYVLFCDSSQKGTSFTGPLYIGKIGKVECNQLSVNEASKAINEVGINFNCTSIVVFEYMVHAFCLEDRVRYNELYGVYPTSYLKPFYIEDKEIITKLDERVGTLWMRDLNDKIEEELRKDAYEEDK